MEMAPMSPIETSSRVADISRIADVTISDSQLLWKMLGPATYTARPLFPITVRELFQNSVDAQNAKGVSTPVEMEVSLEPDGSVVLTFTDAGIGMDEDTIHDKFLALGGSGKDGSSVGGFGIAKASIIGACSEWQLYTQDNYLDSTMIGKQPIRKMSDWLDGCKLVLKYNADEENAGLKLEYSVMNRAIQFLSTSSREIKIVTKHNDQKWETIISPYEMEAKCSVFEITNEAYTAKAYLAPKVTLSYQEIYAGKYNHTSSQKFEIKEYVIYRVNGLTQFLNYQTSTAGFNIIVDVTPLVKPGDANYPFSASREMAKQSLKTAVEDKAERFFKNPLSTLRKLEAVLNKEPEQKIKHYDGAEITVLNEFDDVPITKEVSQETEEKIAAIAEVIAEVDKVAKDLPELEAVFINKPKPIVLHNVVTENPDFADKIGIEKADEASPVSYQMCIKYRNTKLSTLSKPKYVKILRVWAELVQQVMQASPEYGHNFSIGFVVDEHRTAEMYYCCDRNTYYYLIDPTQFSVSKGQETIFKMFQYAAHEVTHKLLYNHDEAFTSAYHKLCDNYMAKFGLKALRRLSKLLLTGK